MSDSISSWLSSLDFGKWHRSFVLVHDLYIDYVFYCGAAGISDLCKPRELTKYLVSLGYELKRISNGMALGIGKGNVGNDKRGDIQ